MNRVLHSPEDRDEIYERFVAYIEEWRIRLVLREWAITSHLEKKDFEQEGAKAGAFTAANPKYHEAVLTLHLPDDSTWEDEEIEDTVIHELMHVLVSTWFAVWCRTHKKPLGSQMLNMLLISEEQLCTRLALGFLRTKYPRRKTHKLTD